MTQPPSSEHSDAQGGIELSSTFNSDAELYDKHRAGYVEPLFDKLVSLVELPEGAKVLEIGSGSGQASVPMAQRGFDLTCIEPGTDLVALAQKKLQGQPSVQFIVDNFESVDLPDESFDLVFSAMALHWVKPEKQYARPYQLLKKGGYLAILYNEPVTDESFDQDDGFMERIVPIYNHFGLIDESSPAYRNIKDIDWAPQPAYTDEAANLFTNTGCVIFRTSVEFDADGFTGYLASLSRVSCMPPEHRTKFLTEINALIKQGYDDHVLLPFAETACVLKKDS